MNSKTNSDETFRHVLKEMMRRHKSSAETLSRHGDTDAAILETIRHNVAEIYLRMFDTSRRIPIPAFNPRIREILHEFESADERSHRVFLYYLDMIGRSWETSLEQARMHDDAEAVMKETVKLEIRNAIRSAYERFRSDAREVRP